MIGVVWGGAPKHEKLIGGTMMKKTFALLLAAVMMLALLTACGGGDKPADTTPPADTSAPADTGNDAAEPEEPAAGGNIGVCIYKFDDAFM